MAMVTITLDNWSKHAVPDAKTLDERIDGFIPVLFDFTVPWYLDNNAGLHDWERQFIVRYFEREIGFDTPEFFKAKLWETLAVKMPFYRLLADQQGLIGNIFINIDEETTAESDDLSTVDSKSGKSVDETTSNTSKADSGTNTTSNSKDVYYGTKEDSGSESENGTDTLSGDVNVTGDTNNTSTVSSTGKALDQSTTTGDFTQTRTDNTTGETTGDKTINESVDKTGHDTNNTQDLQSQNPQINIAGKDFASQLGRAQSITDNTNDTVTTGHDTDNGTTHSFNEVHDNNDTHESKTIEHGTEDESTTTANNKSTSLTKTDNTNSREMSRTHANTSKDGSETDKNLTATDTAFNDATANGTRSLLDDTKTNETRTGVHQGKNKTSGWRGSRADEYKRFAESVKNINEMLLDECNILFIGILPNPWANGLPIGVTTLY